MKKINLKTLLLLVTSFTTLQSFALSSLPDGNWAGTGRYQMQGAPSGNYTEKATIKNNVFTSELNLPGGESAIYVTTFHFLPGDFVTTEFFEKKSGKTMKGNGYCGSIWCHVQDETGKFEMTFVFEGDKIYELGSDIEKGQKGYFESTLTKSAG